MSAKPKPLSPEMQAAVELARINGGYWAGTEFDSTPFHKPPHATTQTVKAVSKRGLFRETKWAMPNHKFCEEVVLVMATDRELLSRLHGAASKMLALWDDISKQNPGFLGKLVVKDCRNLNEALDELPAALALARERLDAGQEVAP